MLRIVFGLIFKDMLINYQKVVAHFIIVFLILFLNFFKIFFV